MAKDSTEELIELINDPLVIEFLRQQPRPASPQPPKPARPSAKQSKLSSGAPLLELPLEMILRIAAHLPPSDQASLYITSKALFRTLAGRRCPLDNETQKIFLETLERDPGVGDRLYYCEICTRLHRYDAWWGVTNWQADPTQAKQCLWSPQPRYANFRPSGWYVFCTALFPSVVRVDYHHGRLVMNRHRRGAPNGLPLDRMRIEKQSWTSVGSEQDGCMVRTAEMEPRIIDDELFLSITATVTAAEGRGCSLEALRAHVTALNLRVCNHEATGLGMPRHDFSPTWLLRKYERWRPSTAGNPAITAWAPCVSSRTPVVVDPCGACATDVISWYELQKGAGPEGSIGKRWVYTLESYHQLGPCRGPEDFESRGFIWCEWPEEAFRQRGYREPARDMVACPGGSVLVRWQERDTRVLDFRSTAC